jgi:signal transduction histidine kinase/PAS domain-containing protein
MIHDAVGQTFSAEILDHLPDVIMWFQPIHENNGMVDDFEISYANKSAIESYSHKYPSLIGLRILKDVFPSADSAHIYFAHFADVYYHHHSKVFRLNVEHEQKHLEIKCSRYLNGVLSNCQDRSTEWVVARKEAEKSMLLDGIVAHAPVGILVYETLRDEAGGIIDFRVKLYNDVVHQLTGISEEERKRLTLKELMITLTTEALYDSYLHTVESGEPFSLEYYNIRTHAWFQVFVVKLGDGFLTTLTDISALKSSQQELERQSLFVNKILDASLNGIYVLRAVRDESGNMVDLVFIQGNGKYTELTGRPIETLIGKSFLEQFPYTKENGFFQALRKVISTGNPHESTNYFAPAFQRWYNLMVVKLGEDSVVITFQEVTQQREANLLIERQKNLLDKILKNSPSGITVYRALRDNARSIIDFKCIMANDAAEKGGYIANPEHLSEAVMNISPHIKGSLIVEMGKSVMEKGEPFQTEHFSGESKKWLELSFSKMDDNHIINVVTDITHIKESQLQMESLIEDLRNSNENLEEFAYAASHDLQEPLRKIHTFSDRLRHELNPQLNESQLLMFERIKGTTERMRNLIEDLLTYSLLNKNSDLEEHVQLNKIVQQVIADYQPLIREANAKVITGELGDINGNQLQLTQLFQNLLSNSLKYRRQDLPPVIAISCRTVNESNPEFKTLPRYSENYLLIQFKDNGIGFEQEHAQKIFHVFQRLHGQSQYQGTGVGLAIVEKVVRNHKGVIYAESEPGKGTTFNIFLPK